MSLTSISVAGRYRLEAEVGRGGMGVVWAAYDELLHRNVAIKQVRYPVGIAAEERERLAGRTLREARAVAAIDDPHAVRVYDIVEQDGQPWIVMEFVRGHTLTDEIRARGPLPTPEVARIGLGLVDALEAAHRAGVLHRDVKPSNVILGDDGRVRLTDFGIAAVDSDDHDVSATGLIMGTPGYLAPERARGEQPTAASDYWSLGATLWTAVEGRPPYAGTDAVTTMRRVVSEDAPGCTTCDSRLAAVVQILMARDSALRPSAGEIRRRLRALLEEPSQGAAPVGVAAGLPASFDSTTVLAGPAPVAPVGDDAWWVLPGDADSEGVAAARDKDRRRPAWLVPAAAAVIVLLAAAALVGVVHRGDEGSSARTAAGRVPSGRPSASPAAAGEKATTGGTTSGAGIGRRHADGTMAGGGTRAGSVAGGSAAGSTTAGGSTSGASAGTTGAAAGTTPSGWQRYTDPSVGWSVAVPAGWTTERRSDGTTVFHDPAGGRSLLVGTRYPPGSSAKGAWEEQESSFAQSHAGYQRIRLENVSWHGYPDVADWEFTYVDGVTLHAVDRGAVVNGRGYGLFFQTRTDQWSASQSILDGIFTSFRT